MISQRTTSVTTILSILAAATLAGAINSRADVLDLGFYSPRARDGGSMLTVRGSPASICTIFSLLAGTMISPCVLICSHLPSESRTQFPQGKANLST